MSGGAVTQDQGSRCGRVSSERPTHESVRMTMTHPGFRLEMANDGHVLVEALSAMIFCHSAIERPYFFSIEGKYEAGPC